ncbi:MAG: pseudouridine synthase [Candidatus Saccharimonadales bacterium]
MRINKFVASATGMSRRAADTAIAEGRVLLNGIVPSSGHDVKDGERVTLDNRPITPAVKTITIMMNKPVGYVVSRNGQGSRTIYSLLPLQYHKLKPVGRLDKESSGLLLLTNDGDLANELTHPSKQKVKVYQISLNLPLQPLHRQMISDHGIKLEDGNSRLQLERREEGNDKDWTVTMREGRNRQIRRTFGSLGYDVLKLHRTQFGEYTLDIPATKHFDIIT